MKNLIYKLTLIIAISFSTTAFLSSCSKNNNDDSNAEANMLKAAQSNLFDRNLVVISAIDDGANVTAKFSPYTFYFTKTGSYSGTASVWNDLFNVNGTWNSDESYKQITISYPTTPLDELVFFNKQWNISSSSEYVELTAANGENDSVRFANK